MKLHLIGISGTGMGSLAGLLKTAGHDVRGSDEHVYPPMSLQLAALGIPVFEGFRAENLDWQPDLVVVGNVCRRDHVEVVTAQTRQLALTSFPAVLSKLFLGGRHSVVVAGTHGKTTTSSLLAFVLADADRDPSFLVGGVPINFGSSFRLGKGPHFVVEGDEYDTAFFDKGSKFLHYQPRTAIVTSVEFDHVDIFRSLHEVKAAFRRFVELIPVDGRLIVAASSPDALEVAGAARCPIETYSMSDQTANWQGKVVETRSGGRTLLEVVRGGKWFCTAETGLSGAYNLENILGVVAAASVLGLEPPAIARGVSRFAGVRRRQEVRGIAQGVTVVDDFAHHPTAVRATLTGLRKRFGSGKLVAVFEPRSASSRRSVFQTQFADALTAADEVVLAPLFQPEKVPAGERLDTERLAGDLRARGVPARVAAGGVDEIVKYLSERLAPGDTVVAMSSGGFDNLHDKLLGALGDAVMPATPGDLSAIDALLRSYKLPPDGVADHLRNFLVLRDEGTLVGCVGLEIYDEVAVLRSLAVIPEKRGQGLGWMLADSAVQRARARGVRRLYLLTETASDFFAQHLGFRIVDRTRVEPPASQSTQFTLGACKSATCMRLDL
ncbi:MAG TPA: UDP-N-acetylmuramate:L-alanyl-gamma-D-glutamyl-meso-diaminopimelate ligase [Polyangia bacterium]|nr:UDP-N-acetylmuramate:L-alanyl-gamma-D-glutamyl-meso-diaminopimelate ligase [Polyangia bacterium]